MNSSTPNTINALLRLLSDPNERVAATIQQQLVHIGESTMSYLDEAERREPALAVRLAEVREEIRFSGVRREFQQLLEGGPESIDLEAGALLIAKSAYPSLDIAAYIQKIDLLARGGAAPADTSSLHGTSHSGCQSVFV